MIPIWLWLAALLVPPLLSFVRSGSKRSKAKGRTGDGWLEGGLDSLMRFVLANRFASR